MPSQELLNDLLLFEIYAVATAATDAFHAKVIC